jgi:hypothetical protein
MSSDIIYQQEIIKFPYPCKGEDIYAWLMLSGSSNVYGGVSGRKRSRSWYVHAVGSAAEIMRSAICLGCSAAGGGLWMGSRSNIPTPHGFIAAARKRLSLARTAELSVSLHDCSRASVTLCVPPIKRGQVQSTGLTTTNLVDVPADASPEQAKLHAYDAFVARARQYITEARYSENRPHRAFGPADV